MARKLVDIINQMDVDQASKPELTALNSPSQVAIYTLWKYITALQIYFVEVLMDRKKVEIQDVVDSGIVGSDYWLQRKSLEFQYSATVPQVTHLIGFVPGYLIVDPSLRIITRCSVKTTASRLSTVKVAKNEPPVALSAPELSAFQSYLNNTGDGTSSGAGVGIGFAGTKWIASSYDSDKFYLKANIVYNGQYAAVIQSTVISAIESYFAALPFDGSVKIVSLIDAIQSVPGVSDVIIEDAAIRPDTALFANKIYLVQGFTELLSTYPTFAGYVAQETTSGSTFTDTLTFTAS